MDGQDGSNVSEGRPVSDFESSIQTIETIRNFLLL